MLKDEVIKSSFSDFSHLVSATFITLFLQIGTTALSTRILGPDNYGKLTLFLMVAQLIFLFGISWTSAAVMRYGREEFVKTGKINKTFWGRNVILLPPLIVFSILIFLFKDRILEYINLQDTVLLMLMFYILGNMLLDYTQYVQQAIGQLKLFAKTKVFQKLLSIIGLFGIFIIPSISKSVLTVIGVSVIAFFGTFFVFICFFKKDYFVPFEIERAYIKKIFTFSYPAIWGSGSAYIISYIDIIVIKKYLNIADVGIYSLSYQGFMALQTVSMSLIAVLGPMMVTFLAEDREDLIKIFVGRIIRQGVLFWSIFLSMVIFFASIFIPIVFGKTFEGSVWPFSILMLGLAFNCMGSFYSPILTTYELIKHMMVINVMMAFINLIGDFILVPRMGISGAAIASSFSFAFSSILYFLVSNRRLGLKEWRQLFSVLPLVGMLLFCLFSNRPLFQGIAFFSLVFLTVLIVKRGDMFKKEDLQIFAKVKMPSFVRRALIFTYEFLSA